MFRLKAFSIHLLISALIALLVAGLVFFIWYPAPLHLAVGVASIFLMLLVIDVILGPTLTLLVYKPGKKSLLLDLSMIALLQLAALAYGLYFVAEGRPVWLALTESRFELVREVDIDVRKLDEAAAEYRKASWLGPQWVAAVLPADVQARNSIVFESVDFGLGIAERPNLYQPLNSQREVIAQRARPLPELEQYNPPALVRKVLKRHQQADGWLPLKASAEDMTVLVNADAGEVIAIVDLRPWN